MTNFSSGDKNIYRRIVNAGENITDEKFLLAKHFTIFKISETSSEHSFSLKWHKTKNYSLRDLTFDLQ